MAFNYEWPYVDPNNYNDDWLIKTVLEISNEWKAKFPEWETRLDQQDALIAQIKQELDQIVQLSPGFMENLISQAIRNVWFGLTDTGYFVAYIPKSWSSIRFATTGYDTTVPTTLEYGHLVLYENNQNYAEYPAAN